MAIGTSQPFTVVETDGHVTYPNDVDAFSPDEQYPEYPFKHLARAPNRVYRLVRAALRDAELDRDRFGTPDWNPLGCYISPGASVFALCNFVHHQRTQESAQAMAAKCTHGSVLRAVLDYIIIAAGPRATIRVGNAPLQSCDWERVLAETGARRVLDFYAAEGRHIEPRDLRLHVLKQDSWGRVVDVISRHTASSEPVSIDLASDSLLAQLATSSLPRPRFRVDDYDPRVTERFHTGNSHRYVIARDVIDADVIVSISKLKTHEKVGLTCTLKGFVGAVAQKDCLAHHRLGGPRQGGDEYRDRHRFLLPLSSLLEWINKRDKDAALQNTMRVGARVAQRVLRELGVVRAGAWSGNDTAWRMTMDLARVLTYADAHGKMHDRPQRTHLAFIDGIIAGEGNGPLAPTPARAGTIVFSNHAVAADRIASRLVGFDPELLPLLREARRDFAYPLWPREAPRTICNGRVIDECAIQPVLGRSFVPPRGWIDVLKGAP